MQNKQYIMLFSTWVLIFYNGSKERDAALKARSDLWRAEQSTNLVIPQAQAIAENF